MGGALSLIGHTHKIGIAQLHGMLRPLLCRILSAVSYLPVRRAHYLPAMASGKLESPNFQALLTPELVSLENLFTSEGYNFRLVGGVVRDLLLGRKPKDIDIATECTPENMIKILKSNRIHYIPTGLQHGTITVHINKVDYEITTLRIDRVTDGRHAVVDFTTDWKQDALRRDLTINAMSLSLDGTLYDYFDGQKHLAEKKVAFVGDARTRIKEDYLRILRYFRFYGRIAPEADRHDQDTLEAIRETAHGLRGVSVERTWAEVAKILVGNHAPHLVRVMYNLGVAHNIGLPENGSLSETDRVWREMTANGYSLEPVSLLMTLIHTVPQALDLAHTWKLSNNEKRLGTFVVEHRQTAYDPNTPLKYYQDLLVDGAPLKSVLELLHYCAQNSLAEEVRQWKVPSLPVSGKDLKAAGFQAGPEMGRLIKRLRGQWKESFFTLERDQLVELAREISDSKMEADS